MDKLLTDRYSIFLRYEAGYDSHPAVLAFELFRDESGDWNKDDHIIDRYDFTDEEAELFANTQGYADEWDIVSPKEDLPPVVLAWGLPQGALDMLANLPSYEYHDCSVVCVGTPEEEN